MLRQWAPGFVGSGTSPYIARYDADTTGFGVDAGRAAAIESYRRARELAEQDKEYSDSTLNTAEAVVNADPNVAGPASQLNEPWASGYMPTQEMIMNNAQMNLRWDAPSGTWKAINLNMPVGTDYLEHIGSVKTSSTGPIGVGGWNYT